MRMAAPMKVRNRFSNGIFNISPGRQKSLARVAIDHRPEKRGEHEENADDAEDDGGVAEKQKPPARTKTNPTTKSATTSQPASPAK